MITILANPSIKIEDGPVVSIRLDTSNTFPDVVKSVSPASVSLNKGIFDVLTKLDPDIQISGTDDTQLVTALNKGIEYATHKYIVWGCQADPGITIDRRIVKIASLTGPFSYNNLGLAQGKYFDARILVPWSLGISRQNTDTAYCLIPGQSDMKFLDLYDTLRNNGVIVIDPQSDIKDQLEMMSKSTIVLTSSITHYIFADALGVPVHPFVSRGNYESFKRSLDDYLLGTNRHSVDILDFRKSLEVTQMPAQNKGGYKIREALESCPLRIDEDIVKSIEEYFNEA